MMRRSGEKPDGSSPLGAYVRRWVRGVRAGWPGIHADRSDGLVDALLRARNPQRQRCVPYVLCAIMKLGVCQGLDT